MIRIFRILALLSLIAKGAVAQTCKDAWMPSGEFLHQLDGSVYAMSWWDPDGEGPAPSLIAVAGRFTHAGPVMANNIALFDPETGRWFSPAGGVFSIDYPGVVYALTIGPTGNLIVGGYFEFANGVQVNNVAEWNGVEWKALGSGTDGYVFALTSDQNGNVVAGGTFQSAGGSSASNIATWNGASWSALQNGVNGTVFALARDANGRLIAGGGFTSAGAARAARIARWNGAEWESIGPGFNTGSVTAILIDGNGKLFAGGSFLSSGEIAIARIAEWDEINWRQVGDGFSSGSVRTLLDLGAGQIVAGGSFAFSNGVWLNHVARWDGSHWLPLGDGLEANVRAITRDQAGKLFVGGEFSEVGPYLACWDGAELIPPFDYLGLSRDVTALGSLPNGDFIAGLDSGGVGGGLVRWDGTALTTLTTLGPISAIATKRNGDFVVGGSFSGRIRAYSGGSWNFLGSGLNGRAYAVLYLSNGDIVAAGEFSAAGGVPANRIARWNGTNWSPLGSGVDNGSFNSYINALAEMPGGDIIAGGVFATAGGVTARYIARWDGASWHSLAEGLDGPVNALAVSRTGELIVGGSFNVAGTGFASNIARWNGETWSPLGSGVDNTVRALTFVPNGDLIAGGMFVSAGSVTTNYVARWNGSGWSSLAAGVDSFVFSLAASTDGTIAVGGDFNYADGMLSRHWATWQVAWGPFVDEQPTIASVCGRGAATFAVSGAGSGALSYQWQWRADKGVDWIDLMEGVNDGGGHPTLFASGSQLSKVSIQILGGVGEECGVRCFVSNECDSVVSESAALRICLADLDCNLRVDDADFVRFVVAYNLLDCGDSSMPDQCSADFNGDGFVDDADFVLFVRAYDALLCA